ncbi:MAG: ScpA family protein [Actinomycetaceae bacterium]|nr:ScpA family protein [Actinomycetaceae bacterium]MDY6083190.1 ScpA family protein [Actinomycetaceae bacterium]
MNVEARSPEPSGQDFGGFSVDLDVFSGPFSVLLSMISRRKLDVSLVALSAVTDEFIQWVKDHEESSFDDISDFVVVALTLLQMKVARLLPHQHADDEDIQLLEARDLLFAKLLQYKAYRQAAADFADRMTREEKFIGRDVPVEEPYRKVLPPVQISLTLAELGNLAAHVMLRVSQAAPALPLAHLHTPTVPIAGQVSLILTRLKDSPATFAQLCSDAPNKATVVSRFLAILELVAQRKVRVSQAHVFDSIDIALIK